MDSSNERQILLGRIVGLSGVKGAVKLESYTEPRMQIFDYQPWLLKSAQGECQISGCRGHVQGKGIVVTLPVASDRDQAAALVGNEVWVRRSALPRLKRGEYYWSDLEGLEVITIDGIKLGRVSHLVATGANDVFVVHDGKRERLIPLVTDHYVKKIDLDTGCVTVDWDPDF